MKQWKEMVCGLLAVMALTGCYREEDGYAIPDIYKGYQPELKDGSEVSGYAAAPLKEVKYDELLNELYITWDGGNASWEKRDEYVGAEVEFTSLLSGKKVQRVMIPNVGTFGNLTVKRRDYDNEPATLRLSKYRTVVVTDRYGVDALRFRSIYTDTEGNYQKSDWTSLSEHAEKYGTEVDKTYVAWQYFLNSQSVPLQLTFNFDESTKTTQDLYNLVGGGSAEATEAAFRKWYYTDCAVMSFEPHNMAFDPYTQMTIFFKDTQTGGAYAIDYPNHKAGRGIVYPGRVADWWRMPDMQSVFQHEMGHCVEWMPKGSKYSTPKQDGCDRQGYQEGWPDAVKIASKAYDLNTQKAEYQTALNYSYADPMETKKFVWQIDYNTSGAFMSWLRLYNGDLVRMLPWTVLMDDLTDHWSLEDAVKYILRESYPTLGMEELWNEYTSEVQAFLENN